MTENFELEKIHQFIETETTCCLCGSILKLKYRKLDTKEILEEGFCTSCDIRAKKKTHTTH